MNTGRHLAMTNGNSICKQKFEESASGNCKHCLIVLGRELAALQEKVEPCAYRGCDKEPNELQMHHVDHGYGHVEIFCNEECEVSEYESRHEDQLADRY